MLDRTGKAPCTSQPDPRQTPRPQSEIGTSSTRNLQNDPILFGCWGSDKPSIDSKADLLHKDTAESLGISVNAARAHPKPIYDKTGVNTQTALVRPLLGVGYFLRFDEITFATLGWPPNPTDNLRWIDRVGTSGQSECESQSTRPSAEPQFTNVCIDETPGIGL